MKWTTLAWMVGCSGGKDDPATPEDTDVPGDTDDTDTTPVDTGTPPEVLAFADLSSALHPDFGTIVVASWTQNLPAAVHLEFSFDDGVWLSSPTRDRTEGAQTELLLGIPYDETVTWRVVADEGVSADQGIDTATLPASIPAMQVNVSEPALQDPGSPYFLVSNEDKAFWALIVDRQFRVVWALRNPDDAAAHHSRVAKDGRSLYIDQNTFWGGDYDASRSTIRQIRIDGTLVHEYLTPGLHHPFTDMPDGGVAYANFQDYFQEYLDIVHPDDSVETVWDCGAWIAVAQPDGALCGSNTLNHDPATNTFLFSFWGNETVAYIDGATGETIGWFGLVNGGFTFDPPESHFYWQHGAYLTDAGTLLLSSDDQPYPSTETVVREYEIDVPGRALHEVCNFGVGDGVFGQAMGEAVRLGNGNTLHNTGFLPRLREATPTGEVVWDVEWVDGILGRSMPIADLYLLAP